MPRIGSTTLNAEVLGPQDISPASQNQESSSASDRTSPATSPRPLPPWRRAAARRVRIVAVFMVHHMATGNLDQRIRAGSRPGQTDRLLRFQRRHRHRHPGAMIGEAEADHHLARDRPDGGSAPKLI